MRPESGSELLKLARNRKNINDVTIYQQDVIVKIFNVTVFSLSILVIAPIFMSISLLVLELWQFSFIRTWRKIRKSEIPSSEFWPISEDRNQLEIPNFVRMSLLKSCWMLQNTRVTAFTVSELLRENQKRSKIFPHPPRLGLTVLRLSMRTTN